MPNDVLAVMDTLGLERVDVMGYSMGGATAINLVARHPDRFSSLIVGGAGLRTASAFNPQTLPAIAEALEADSISTISDPTARFFRAFAESRAQDPRSLADADPDLRAYAAIARRRSGLHTPEDVVTAARDIQVPVLAVVGDKDPVLSEARRLTDTVPNAQLVTVPGGDHITTVPTAEYKSAVATFLDSLR